MEKLGVYSQKLIEKNKINSLSSTLIGSLQSKIQKKSLKIYSISNAVLTQGIIFTIIWFINDSMGVIRYKREA